MPYLAEYLLKLSVSLIVVYLFYVLVLRRLTFYAWNRWYLLGYSALSFLIPFINISLVLDEAWSHNMVIQLVPAFGAPVFIEAAGKESVWETYGYWTIIFAFILPGMAVMMFRFLVHYYSLWRIRKSARLLVNDTVKVYHLDRAIIPFSFGNSIFINKRLHPEEELQQIIYHEFVHVKQRHTADLLWSELLCIVNWYNPFAWLIRKAIRQNLEFIADQEVLQNGMEKKEYQYLLLRVTDASRFTITNHFNFSSLKKRIIMMNRSRSAKIQLGRFLFVLPVMAILLLAFRSSVTQTKKVMPDIPAADQQSAQPIVSLKLHTDTVPVPQKPAAAKGPGKAKKPVAPVATDASRKGPQNVFKLEQPGNALVIIDGKVQSDGNEAIRNLPADAIQSVNVIKGETALKLYGDKGKNGVIDIVTKKGAHSGNVIVRTLEQASPAPLHIVDDKEYSLDEFNALDIQPHQIQSINVLKGETATARYGTKGKNGVIIVTLKK